MDTHRYLILVMRTARFDVAAIELHQRFLDELRARGVLELQGPFADRTGGAYLLRAQSLADAQAIAARDPLIVTGSSRASVYEWMAS